MYTDSACGVRPVVYSCRMTNKPTCSCLRRVKPGDLEPNGILTITAEDVTCTRCGRHLPRGKYFPDTKPSPWN